MTYATGTAPHCASGSPTTAAGEKAYQGERFFWQTPKKDFALVGFGYETILKGAETETHQL
ncbi:hypothetical protein, partial [Enterococcus faecalis]|uniref:hypothetical protein n=1 Tax=Enterococcus faecalis TaxID=1351 RepID=UPI00349F0BFD